MLCIYSLPWRDIPSTSYGTSCSFRSCYHDWNTFRWNELWYLQPYGSVHKPCGLQKRTNLNFWAKMYSSDFGSEASSMLLGIVGFWRESCVPMSDAQLNYVHIGLCNKVYGFHVVMAHHMRIYGTVRRVWHDLSSITSMYTSCSQNQCARIWYSLDTSCGAYITNPVDWTKIKTLLGPYFDGHI